jgi:hypothetical protein
MDEAEATLKPVTKTGLRLDLMIMKVFKEEEGHV